MWQNQKERCRNTTEKHAAACVYVRKATESAQPVCNSVPPPYTSWTTLFWDMASQQKRKRERTLSYIKRERKALAKLGRCCTDDTGVVVDVVVVVVSRVGWCVILVLVGAVAVWPLLLPLYCVLDKPCSQCANNRKRPARVPMPKFRSDGSKRCTTMDGGGGGIYRPMSLSYKTGSPCQCVQPNDDRR